MAGGAHACEDRRHRLVLVEYRLDQPDWRSFVHNYEADLIVHDRGFARDMERRFIADLEQSVEVRPARWRERGSFERLKEWFARQWEYLL